MAKQPVTIICVLEQPIDIYLGAWIGNKFVATLVMTLTQGKSRRISLEPIVEGTGFKRGQSLLVRVKNGVGAYTVRNDAKWDGYLCKVKPAKFPWWKGTTFVTGGFQNPWILRAGKSTSSIILAGEQDVYYYFVLA
jgi:hypothetical protein